MQLSEIKNDLATINYSPEINKLMLGDFILVEDTNQSILSQIISIEATLADDVNSAMLKFLLSIDKEANLTQYNGYVPAKNASLILINPEEVTQLIKGTDKNICFGSLAAYPDTPVELSMDFLRKRTYIQVDFVENKIQIVKSIIKGLEKHNRKTLLFDFQGLYESFSLPTVTIGYNFKLPLNYDALCYIAEEELNDFSNENKAIIQGILIEVQNYVKTTKDEFIPFDTLISVLDAQYDESPVSELLLLKNKLLKYQQQGLFAQEKSEFDFLDSFLKDAKNFKFDLSEVPSQWHKIAIVSILNIIKAKCYLIADFSDDNSNKTIIKKLYEKTEIKPIVISSYNYKYQQQLKAMSKNMILFKPIQKINDFAGYTSFLNILSQDTFIVWGEQTLYIPLILKLNNDLEQKIDKISYAKLQNQDVILPEEVSENIDIVTEDTIENSDDIQNTDNIENIENAAEEEISCSEVSQDYDELIDNTENSFDSNNNEASYEDNIVDITEQEVQISNNKYEDDLPNSNDMDFFFDENENEINQVENNIENMIEEDEQQLHETQEIIEDEQDSVNDTVETEDIPEINTEPEYENPQDDEEIVSDLDDAIISENLIEEDTLSDSTEENADDFAEKSIEEIEEINQFENSVEETTDEPEISNINDEESTEQTEEPQTEGLPVVDVKPASVPVYTSNVAPQFDTKFAQGTFVHHPKYGRGVVEKVINYGSKELCLIIFDNEGRKLLDPNLAELKQV